MNVVVTGGTGFLGNALVRELAQNGDDVTVLVRKNSRRIKNVQNVNKVTIVEANLEEKLNLPEKKYDVFYHLAWEGERDNYESQCKNIIQAINCLNTAKKYGCKRFICTGSQAEYGETNNTITEETPVNPSTSYGTAKVATYYLLKDLARHLDIEFIWTRVFSVYGENDNLNTLYSQLLHASQNSQDYTLLTDGKHMWNFLHETDAARALRLLYNDNVDEGVYNLASKYNKPLSEYVKIISKTVNPSVKVYFGNVRSKINLNASIDKLLNTIGEFEKVTFPGINIGQKGV